MAEPSSLGTRRDATSARAAGDAPSPRGPGDTGTRSLEPSATSRAAAPDRSSFGAVATRSQRRACGWCSIGLLDGQRRWCSKRCRQTAWRARSLAGVEERAESPKRLAYADPPYPGLARKYYADQPSYAGEVDHRALLEQLAGYDGWALSTSVRALRDLLPLCPPEARVCAWVKPIGANSNTLGLHNMWEPLIVLPARRRKPGLRDFLIAQPARFGGELPGRKPLKFCGWLFAALGASPIDTLDDLFPGTGVVGNAWRQFQTVRSWSEPLSPLHAADAAEVAHG